MLDYKINFINVIYKFWKLGLKLVSNFLFKCGKFCGGLNLVKK